MPIPQQEVHNIVADKAVVTDLPDVWPTGQKPMDTSRIDMIAGTLNKKLMDKIGSSEPEKTLRQIFGLSNSNEVDCDTFVRLCATKLNFVGYEEEVRNLFKRFDLDRRGKVSVMSIFSILTGDPNSRANTSIGKVREILQKRSGGISSLKTLGLQFRLLDGDQGDTLSKAEMEQGLKKFMAGFNQLLSKQEIDSLFKYFDVDDSNSITYDEFLRGIRGDMNEKRLYFVKKAFFILDLNKDGVLTLEEIARRYNASENPLVKSGKMSEADALRCFVAHWHINNKSSSDVVTLDEFVEYYQWVSASIDRDDYFELMMRNAWHMSGGEGSSANTSNIRVLVTHEDGHQSVEEVKDDFDIDRHDIAAIKNNLSAQGIKVTGLSLHD